MKSGTEGDSARNGARSLHASRDLFALRVAEYYLSTIAGSNDRRHNQAVSALNELSAETKIACDAAGLQHGVSSAIDPRDWIFWFLYN